VNWIVENNKDAKLINHVDLSALDVELVKDHEELAGHIERHNAALTELRNRFTQVAADRETMSLTDNWLDHDSEAVRTMSLTDNWLDHDSEAVRTERGRLIAESWDALVSLREALRGRQALLRQCEAHVADQSSKLADKRERAFTKAQKALTREHNEYVKSEPVHGPAYVAELASDDEAVVCLRRQEAALNEIWDRLQTMRRRATTDMSAVAVRQRGLIEYLNN